MKFETGHKMDTPQLPQLIYLIPVEALFARLNQRDDIGQTLDTQVQIPRDRQKSLEPTSEFLAFTQTNFNEYWINKLKVEMKQVQTEGEVGRLAIFFSMHPGKI